MCGIFGIWNRDGAPLDLSRVESATQSLLHRGPDDAGYLLVQSGSGRHVLAAASDTSPALGLPHLRTFAGQAFDLAFGFRRLSILDLSPAGHQPMSDPSGRYWIIFNGEIYNFIELREELEGLGHRFRSGTDTEVILAVYAQWGPAGVERLRGMFALAIWDAREQSVWIARDRFGIKPLYVVLEGQSVAFASEAKALIRGGIEFRPSDGAIGAYVAFGRLPSAPSGATFFEGIESLPAATTATLQRNAVRRSRYWSIPDPEGPPMPVAAFREAYAERFSDSIRVHLRADVPIGTCLSGGLDSSSIVAFMARLLRNDHAGGGGPLGDRLQTFSAVYHQEGVWNERSFIDRVNDATGAAQNLTFPTRERLLSDLDALVWHQDEPVTTTSMFAQWCVMSLARERGVTVLLDGQGADETLAGYHNWYQTYVRDLLKKRQVLAALGAARDMRRVAGAPGERYLLRELLRSVPALQRGARARRNAWFRRTVSESPLANPIRALLEESGMRSAAGPLESSDPGLHEALVLGVTDDPLPHLLRYEDRNGMAFSVEGRVPFLDHPLVELLFRHGDSFRIRDGWTKWIQRVTAEPLLPAEITWRRDKVGFATPEQHWLADSEALVRDAFDASPRSGSFLDRSRLAAASKVPVVAWRCLSVATWLRVFGAAAGAGPDRDGGPGVEMATTARRGDLVATD